MICVCCRQEVGRVEALEVALEIKESGTAEEMVEKHGLEVTAGMPPECFFWEFVIQMYGLYDFAAALHRDCK